MKLMETVSSEGKMITNDFDNEWKFIQSEVNGFNSSSVSLNQREIIFALQIILSRVGTLKDEAKRDFLTERYSDLKKVYLLN